MKRLPYILAASLALLACTNTEYLDFEEIDPALVINAQMTSGEDIHDIHLSISKRSRITPATGGSLSVSISGAAPQALTGTEPEYGNSVIFPFEKALKSGDVLVINASCDGMKASCTVTVPDAPDVRDVSLEEDVPHATASSGGIFDFGNTGVYDPDWEGYPFSPDAWHLLQIKLQDAPGRDGYYRLSLFVETTLTDRDGNSEILYQAPVRPDIKSEPVLSPASSGSGGFFDELFSDSNSMMIFTDELFKDKEYTLKLYIPEYDLLYYRKYEGEWIWDEEAGEYRKQTELPEGCSYSACIVARVHSMSHDQYIYLKALGLDDLSFLFSEPVSIPSNVEGGMGFAAVDAVQEFRIPIGVVPEIS